MYNPHVGGLRNTHYALRIRIPCLLSRTIRLLSDMSIVPTPVGVNRGDGPGTRYNATIVPTPVGVNRVDALLLARVFRIVPTPVGVNRCREAVLNQPCTSSPRPWG